MNIKKRIIPIILSFFIVFSNILMRQVNAAEDTTPPTLNSVAINKIIGASGDTLTVTVNAQDDISGLESSMMIMYDPPAGTSSKTELLYLKSNGTYSGNITIGANDALGLWKVRGIMLTDNAGNTIQVYNKETYPHMPNITDLSGGNFEIKGTLPDTEPPTLNSVTINKNIGTSGDILTVTVNAQDDISGLESSMMIMYDPPAGTSSKTELLYLKSNGTYSGNITIGANDALGLWKVRGIMLTDNAGNTIQVYNKETYPHMPNITDLSGGNFEIKARIMEIEYNGNGSTGGTVPTDSSTYLEGAKVTIIGNNGALTKTGATFAGWNTKSDGNGINYVAGATFTMGTENVTLYAKWTTNNYTITFNSQGGSSVTSKIAGYNSVITAPTSPTKTGYTFGGWYKEAGCTNKWDFATNKVTANTTLYAKWTINNYTVTFNSQGGSTVTSKATAYNSVIAAPTLPTRTGYTFGGWFKESSCINTWDFSTDKVTIDSTLYAKWTINNYAVTFNSQGGSAVTSKAVGYNSVIIAPTSPTKTGYTFGGWYKEATCVNVWNFTTNKVITSTTLYAKWTIVKSVTGVTLDKTNVSLIVGGTTSLIATVSPSGATNKNVTWTSDNTSVAKVDSNGNVTAVGYGNATIKAKTADGGYTASCAVSINTAASKSIEDFVSGFYELCLDRQADAAGLKFWKDKLLSKTSTGADVANSFIVSPEFVKKNVSNDAFIDIMYKTFFDRAGDKSGKDYWTDKLNNGISRLYVLSSFVNSTEFSTICNSYGISRGSIQLTKVVDIYPEVTAFTYRFYDKCLGRKPDDVGLNYWVNKLVTGQSTGAGIAQNFVFSPEFISKNLSNTDFTTIMYRVFFNREPDSAGQTYWVNTLKAGKSRFEVLSGFVGSKEFTTICNSYEIKVGTVKK